MTKPYLRLTLMITTVPLLYTKEAVAQAVELGRAVFEARCVSCHGSDGTGSDRGPNIVDGPQPRSAGSVALREIVRAGTPDGGMPAFPLPATELDAVVAHVEMLRAPAADHPVAGDVALGELFFVGRGTCSSCHAVAGSGGVLGPDLSNLGRERTLSQIQRALLQPGSVPLSGSDGRRASQAPSRAVSLRMDDGEEVRGVLKYETLFDLGILDLAGRFRSIPRGRIAEVTREPSIMPPLQASPEETRNLLAYLTRLTGDGTAGTTSSAEASPGQGVSFADIADPDPGDWPTYNGHLSGNRHSPLSEIDTTNVTRLVPKWTAPIADSPRSLEVTPLVVDGVMYVTAVNQVLALDARTGQQIWRYIQPRTQGQVPSSDAASGINRGVAVLGDRVFLQTDHAHLLALHRMTGQLLWDVEIADYREHYGSTSAPLVVNDLVIVGVSGGDEGIRGLIDAYRASTGERVWRFWTVPARGEPGSESWIGRALEHGCAATWLTGTYDAEARLLYWTTGNPCPDFNGEERMGDNLYSNSVVALDPETGTLVWHFQFTPHDLHDWDATETPMLVDASFRGRPRKLLLHGNRNGFFYVLDRLTGEFLLAEPFVQNLTWASGIDEDGRPLLLPGQEPTPEGTRTCPAVSGATNWPSPAFNPATGLFYLMAAESCGIYSSNSQWWIEGQSFYGGTTRRSPVDTSTKYLRAIDLETGSIAWEIPGLAGGVTASGILSTAGGLLLFGDSAGGAFVAADATTGELLWHFGTGLDWKASPMTYAIDGEQYIGMAGGRTIMVFGLP